MCQCGMLIFHSRLRSRAHRVCANGLAGATVTSGWCLTMFLSYVRYFTASQQLIAVQSTVGSQEPATPIRAGDFVEVGVVDATHTTLYAKPLCRTTLNAYMSTYDRFAKTPFQL